MDKNELFLKWERFDGVSGIIKVHPKKAFINPLLSLRATKGSEAISLLSLDCFGTSCLAMIVKGAIFGKAVIKGS